ncbi:MAG: EamA family transporter, partial [Dehalococcoidia bacterium]
MRALPAIAEAPGARRPLVTFGLCALLCLLWGLTYTAVKAALSDASPLALAFVRGLISIPPTVALGLAFGGRFPTDRRFHVLALALGLCNGAGLTAFINLGANHVSS